MKWLVFASRWRFSVQMLGQQHVVSVALGPPEDIIDAWGVSPHPLNCACDHQPRVQVMMLMCCKLYRSTGMYYLCHPAMFYIAMLLLMHMLCMLSFPIVLRKALYVMTA